MNSSELSVLPSLAFIIAATWAVIATVAAAPALLRYREPDESLPDAATKIRYQALATPQNLALIAVTAFTITISGALMSPVYTLPLWLWSSLWASQLAVIDLRTTWIPNRGFALAAVTLLPALGTAVLLGMPIMMLTGALVVSLLVMMGFFILVLPKRGIGLADVWFAPLVTLPLVAVGWMGMVMALCCGFILTAIAALYVRNKQRHPSDDQIVPLTPGLVGGLILVGVLSPAMGQVFVG